MLGVSSIHFAFSLLRFPHSLNLGWSGWDPLRQIFHAYMIIFEVALPIHFCSCVILAEYNKLLFNDLIDGLPTERMKRREMTDWIVICDPFIAVYIIVVAFVGILVDVGGYHHFHCLLPTSAHIVFYLLSLAVEMIALLMAISTWGYYAAVQLLFFQDWINNVRDGATFALKKLKAGAEEEVHDDIMDLYGRLRKMQLTVTYFNHAFAIPIYICKVLCLSDSTWGTFMFIKCWHSQPLVAVLGLLIALLDGSWYAILYGQAYKVEEDVVTWKRRLLARARHEDRAERKLLELSVKSVPDYGLRAGGFHKLHKGTALEFYDFVANNVLTLLISYPVAFSA